MALLIDDAGYNAGEAFGNVPSWSNAGNNENYGREHGTRYAPQGIPDAAAKFRKQSRTNTRKFKRRYEDQYGVVLGMFAISF
ncbi:unnamed protein product [Protopolystoma xenopodis]|uniref:Uncharacterized protein n=1 Tax=Protopolystoma xenopodis TaxID=117903 RepID=A0A448WDL0_9PLAT|nr:unnamed protein product [Protopolystoma xenopodis]